MLIKVPGGIFQGVEFKLEIKNLATSDSKGHDLEKEIVVRVTNVQSRQVCNVHAAGFQRFEQLFTDDKLLF